jgi:hypothetical protein
VEPWNITAYTKKDKEDKNMVGEDMIKTRSLVILLLVGGVVGFSLMFLFASIAVDNCGMSGTELTVYKALCLIVLPVMAGLAVGSYILKLFR